MWYCGKTLINENLNLNLLDKLNYIATKNINKLIDINYILI
jgi:hypothetical protein